MLACMGVRCHILAGCLIVFRMGKGTPDGALRWLLGVVAAGIGVNLVSDRFEGTGWAVWVPALALSIIAVMSLPGGVLRPERQGSTRWACILGILLILSFPVVSWQLTLLDQGFFPPLAASTSIWLGASLVSWQTLRGGFSLGWVCVLVGLVGLAGALVVIGIGAVHDGSLLLGVSALGAALGLLVWAYTALGKGRGQRRDMPVAGFAAGWLIICSSTGISGVELLFRDVPGLGTSVICASVAGMLWFVPVPGTGARAEALFSGLCSCAQGSSLIFVATSLFGLGQHFAGILTLAIGLIFVLSAPFFAAMSVSGRIFFFFFFALMMGLIFRLLPVAGLATVVFGAFLIQQGRGVEGTMCLVFGIGVTGFALNFVVGRQVRTLVVNCIDWLRASDRRSE